MRLCTCLELVNTNTTATYIHKYHSELWVVGVVPHRKVNIGIMTVNIIMTVNNKQASCNVWLFGFFCYEYTNSGLL